MFLQLGEIGLPVDFYIVPTMGVGVLRWLALMGPNELVLVLERFR